MTMETISLLDDEKQSSLRTDLTLEEIYNTRLVRADRGPRDQQDPIERLIHKYLRLLRYWRLSKRVRSTEDGLYNFGADHNWSYQNTVFLAAIIVRVIIAILTGVFLVLPLAILSTPLGEKVQLAIVSAFIIAFSLLITVMLKASNLSTIMVSAAYAAVLSVFVSNVPTHVS